MGGQNVKSSILSYYSTWSHLHNVNRPIILGTSFLGIRLIRENASNSNKNIYNHQSATRHAHKTKHQTTPQDSNVNTHSLK